MSSCGKTWTSSRSGLEMKCQRQPGHEGSCFCGGWWEISDDAAWNAGKESEVVNPYREGGEKPDEEAQHRARMDEYARLELKRDRSDAEYQAAQEGWRENVYPVAKAMFLAVVADVRRLGDGDEVEQYEQGCKAIAEVCFDAAVIFQKTNSERFVEQTKPAYEEWAKASAAYMAALKSEQYVEDMRRKRSAGVRQTKGGVVVVEEAPGDLCMGTGRMPGSGAKCPGCRACR